MANRCQCEITSHRTPSPDFTGFSACVAVFVERAKRAETQKPSDAPEKKSVSEILFGKFVKIHSNVADRGRGTTLAKISRKSRRDEKFYFRHRSMLDLQPYRRSVEKAILSPLGGPLGSPKGPRSWVTPETS